MIKRGERTKTSAYDDAMICPNCGSQLTYIDGMLKCTSCEYQLMFNEIDYSQIYSRLCVMCGNSLAENELQICQRCKDKIVDNWNNISKEN